MQLRGYTERNSKNHLQSPIMIKWCLIESSQRLKNKKKSTTLSLSKYKCSNGYFVWFVFVSESERLRRVPAKVILRFSSSYYQNII